MTQRVAVTRAVLLTIVVGGMVAAGCRAARPAVVEVEVVQVGFDAAVGSPVVVLESADAQRLPIWIGAGEADAIARELQGIVAPRPLTHDLLIDVLESVQWELTRVRITELREQTFHAVLEIERGAHAIQIDCRPSDAIALALRAGASIVVSRGLLERVGPMVERRSATWFGLADPAQTGARLTKFRAMA